MDFSLTEEQSLLRDSVERFVRDHGTVERHRGLCQSGQAYDAAGWQQFADLGWRCHLAKTMVALVAARSMSW